MIRNTLGALEEIKDYRWFPNTNFLQFSHIEVIVKPLNKKPNRLEGSSVVRVKGVFMVLWLFIIMTYALNLKVLALEGSFY